MAATEHEWARRIKAAAAYAGLERQELAKRLGMSDSTLRRNLLADKRPHEVRALCQTVAEITDLPYEFFTVDFSRLSELAQKADFVLPDGTPVELKTALSRIDQRSPEYVVLVHLAGELAEMRNALVHGGISLEQIAINEGRGMGETAVDLVEDDAPGAPGADDTRDEADATQEAARARAAGKPADG